MAFRVFARSVRFCGRLAASAQKQSASEGLFPGGASCRGVEGRKGFVFVPACFITSEAFLTRLANGAILKADAPLPSVLPNSGEHLSLLLRHPDQPAKSKVLKVAIIGSPNAGKSTLSNQLLGRKVFAVSKKVHTTRNRAMGVLTEGDTQIILLDTPGLTTVSKVKRHQLEKSLLVDPWNTVKEADLMVVMVDVADRWMCSRLDFEVLKCLAQHPDTPAILVLNKVDKVKAKDRLLDITAVLTCGMVNGHKMRVRPVIKPPWAKKLKEQLKVLRSQLGWPHFKDVFMLSSVDSDDVETLKTYFITKAKTGSWKYHSEVLTDQSPEEVCTNLIREKLLEYLPQEVPYAVTQSIEFWQEGENGELHINVKLYAKKDTHMKMLIGTAGQVVARMAQEAGEDLGRVFLRNIKLKLSVKLKT
uniref:GTPase Era, mitochondrial n=1 Tax=Takifugu rubripes TaxID=31033 RepID=A0A674NW23_TAKRU